VFEPNWIVNDDGDGTFSNFFQSYNMAWDPSGLIGYVVLVGVQESEFGYEPIPKPNVWKTVDGPTTQFFYHCQTEGETSWEANIITEVINSDDAADFTLGDQPLRFKVQISRTADGSKIFFSYHKAIDNLILTSADVFARGYDVDSDIYCHEKNLTLDSDFEEFSFYQTMSPICKVDGECHAYELPIVFIEPGSDDLSYLTYLGNSFMKLKINLDKQF